jgi:aminoglycoside phosphotransferase (APT) family kinase protein
MGFDPADLSAIRDAIQQHLNSALGPVSIVDGPTPFGGGLDTYTYSFRLGGATEGAWRQPLVLRVYPAAEQAGKARREYAVQEFATARGYPAARPLLLESNAASLGLPFMIMERLPGTPLVDRFKNPLTLNGAMAAMADLQVRLHRLPVEGCPLPSDPPLVVRQLEALRLDIERFELAGLDRAVSWVEAHQDAVVEEEISFLHNDFHPLNIIADRDSLGVLDWSDAALGDRHHDLARTLALIELAPPLARSRVERTLLTILRPYILRRYVARYEARLPVDAERLRYWQAVHALRAWVQILALETDAGRLGAREGAGVPPGLLAAVQRYFSDRTEI